MIRSALWWRFIAALLALGIGLPARAAEPIKIGFSMELTGPSAVVGKTGAAR